MNPVDPNLSKTLNLLELTMTRYQALSLIFISPFIILISQMALAVREIALNTRKEFVVETEYKILEWTAIILTFIGFFALIFGIVILVKTF